jgi:hypothetical protein
MPPSAHTNLRPMSTSFGGEDLGDHAAVPVPLDNLAANLDTGNERIRAANDIVPHTNC